MLTPSSRARPAAPLDLLSDYDVILAVIDNEGASDSIGQQVTISDTNSAAQMHIAAMSGTPAPDIGGWNATVTWRWSPSTRPT